MRLLFFVNFLSKTSEPSAYDDDVHPHHDYKAQVFADQQLLTESRQMIGNWSCSQQSVLTA